MASQQQLGSHWGPAAVLLLESATAPLPLTFLLQPCLFNNPISFPRQLAVHGRVRVGCQQDKFCF